MSRPDKKADELRKVGNIVTKTPSRDLIQRRREKKITREALAGVIDARQLSEYHWRVWATAHPGYELDYWPQTGEVRNPRNPVFRANGSVSFLMKLMRVNKP